MLLRSMELCGQVWDVYVAMADHASDQLEVVFVRGDVGEPPGSAYAWPVDEALLGELLRAPFGVKEELLVDALTNAVASNRRSERGLGPVRLI